MPDFVRHAKVRFSETDFSGIIFYPRYFEGLNATIEDWLDDAGIGFGDMIARHGLGTPLVSVEAEFVRPSLLGDMLEYRLTVARIGSSSITFDIEVACGEEVRMRATLTHVCVALDSSSSVAWPPGFLEKFDQAKALP